MGEGNDEDTMVAGIGNIYLGSERAHADRRIELTLAPSPDPPGIAVPTRCVVDADPIVALLHDNQFTGTQTSHVAWVAQFAIAKPNSPK